MNQNILLIGVDGGATEAKVRAASCDSLEQPRSFGLRPEAGSRVYERLPGFVPMTVSEQLAQRDAGAIQLSESEVQQGELWVAGAAEAIAEVARKAGATRLLVGVGMPGLKTPDGRGIHVINNGPRIPNYLVDLERRLAADGLELAAPIAALGSDADYCGLGEEYAADGLFRDVKSAYYVGCGTGIADAMKLRGELVPFDRAKPWMQKSWQIPSALGPTFEKLAAASSMNRIYADLRGGASSEFPEVDAAAGNPVAAAWLATIAAVLAELIFERLWTIRNGRMQAAYRGDSYRGLDANHPYRGLLLDRVIVGQRIGLIYADTKYRALLGEKLDACLAALLAACDDAELRRAHLAPDGARLRSGFVRGSRLRAAPALGAAVAAVQSFASRAS